MQVQQQSPGFSSDNVLSATIDLPNSHYADAASQANFYARLLDAVRVLPGVKSAGLVNNMPFSGNDGSGSYLVEGRDAKATTPHAYQQMVDEDFFKTMQIPVLRGRTFTVATAQRRRRWRLSMTSRRRNIFLAKMRSANASP